MLRGPPRSTRTDTLFPCTTLFRSARQVIELKMQRGAEFTSPALVKEYLRNKLAGFEHEVFAGLFLDTRHRLIEYQEMFHGTIDSRSEEHTSVLQSLIRLLYDALCLTQKTDNDTYTNIDRSAE